MRIIRLDAKLMPEKRLYLASYYDSFVKTTLP